MSVNTFIVTIENAQPKWKTPHHKSLWNSRMMDLEGQEIALKIDERKPKRTDAQSRYYFLYLGILSLDLGYTKDELHAYFKGKYLTTDIKEVFGQKTRITNSTKELNKTEFSELIQNIEAETEIPSPDTTEYTRGGILLDNNS